MKIKNNSFVKILSVLCATALLLTALFANPTIISALNDGSDDSVVNKGDIFATPIKYGFEPSEDPVTDKTVTLGSVNMTRGGDRMAVMGYAWDVVASDAQHGKTLVARNENMNETFAISGGYRINNSDGVYRLKKNTTYVVQLDINLTSAHSVGDSADITSNVYLGYGSKDSNMNDANGIDTMSQSLFNIVSVKKNAEQYTVTSSEGKKAYDVDSGWHTLTYVFTTPVDFGNADSALAFYASLMPGAEIQIDNVSVKVLGEDEGIVIFTDEYHGNNIVVLSDIGDEVELPVITPENPENAFLGWYSDYDRNADSKVESGYKMVAGVTNIYALIDAPVTITFNNTLAGTSETVTGRPGEKIPYPAFPSDSVKWFAGWFATEEYTEEYTEENYSYTNIVLYSKWVDPVSSAIEDFNTYTKDAWESVENDSGQTVKSNYLYFGRMCSISDFAYGDSGKSWKYTWDSEMKLDEKNPESYNSERYKDYDSSTVLEDVNLVDKTTYLVTFKYYAEKISTGLNVIFNSADKTNTWGSRTGYNSNGSIFTVSPEANDGEWHEGSVVLTTSFNNTGNAMFINVTMNQNSDAVLYIDDVEFSPIKPTESYIVYNFGAEKELHIGEIGSSLPHAKENAEEKYTNEIWCVDASFATLLKEKVYTREPLVAYARRAITFNNDTPYNSVAVTSMNKGNTVDIVNEKGIGNGDDYALKIVYDGDVFLRTDEKTGKNVYWRDRYNMWDFQALIKTQLKADTVYIISYDIKTEKSSLDYSVLFNNAHPTNIWGASGKNFVSTSIAKETQGDGWISHTTALKTPEKIGEGTGLYLNLQFAHNLEGQYAEIYIDNVLAVEATAPVAVFDAVNGTDPVILSGSAGSAINIPASPSKIGFDFAGWYNDKATTEAFTATTFSDSKVYYAFAAYKEAKTMVFDYESYYVPYATPGDFQRHDSWAVEVPFAYSGDYVMMADRSTVRHPDLNGGGAGHRLMNGNLGKQVSKDKNYIITFKYYIEVHGQSPLTIRAFACSEKNFWAASAISNGYAIALDEKTGVWHTGTLVCNGSKIQADYQKSLYISWISGNEGLYYIDDVVVTEMEEGQIAYFIDNGGCPNIPEYVIGRVGESFASQLPKNPKYDNHKFLGYFVLGDDGKYQEFSDMKFYADKIPAIVARFIRLKTIQDFETYYAPAIAAMTGYSILDYDYELYDALAKGNTRDNVTSGRYSLHRLGKSHYFENALLLTQAQQLTAGEKYTVTFKVKMPSYLQTDGAIKLVSCNSPIFAWATMGDYYPVAAVKDLTDGQWHELSYTFIAIEPYVSIQTPGYCELFIDDVVFTHVSQDTQVSLPVSFTEYVPAKRDLTTGEILTTVTEIGNVDVSTIIDDTLTEGSFGSSVNVTVIIISVVAAVIIAAVVVVLLLLKKKKKA